MARHQSWDADVGGSLVGLTVMLMLLIAFVLCKVATATAKEIGRVYLENAHATLARLLWYSLGGLFGVWLLCGVVAAAMPAVGAACVYGAAWAFLVYVLAIEMIDWRARPGLPRAGSVGSLDTYLDLGVSERSTAKANGNGAMAGAARRSRSA